LFEDRDEHSQRVFVLYPGHTAWILMMRELSPTSLEWKVTTMELQACKQLHPANRCDAAAALLWRAIGGYSGQ